MPDPRWLDRAATAAYISVRVDQIPRLLRDGKLPAPSYHLGPRSPRWDRDRLDAHFAGDVGSGTKGAASLASAILEEAR